jgi:threonine dehydrogenase-like Zn-dependent dehydrogenase
MSVQPSVMRAWVNTGPGKLEACERPIPKPGPGQVRIRTAACGVCATDLEMIAGWKRTDFPAIPGHEWAGTVDAIGPGASASLLGKPCVAENVWTDGGEVGFEHPGGYAPYFLTEARLVHELPAGFPLTAAVLIEPLAVAVRGLNRLGPSNREPVLVLGDGPIGLLLTLLIASDGGGAVTLVGGRDARLELARAMGASATYNYHAFSESPVADLRRTSLTGYPTVMEATGNSRGMAWALEAASRGGRVLVLGDYGTGRADFAWNTLLHRELTLIGSNASAGGWDRAVAAALAESAKLAKLITHRLPAERFPEAVKLAGDRASGAVKVVVEW